MPQPHLFLPGSSAGMQTKMQLESRSDVAIGTKAPEQPARWTPGTRIAFRFAFVYFGLYILYLPLHLLSFPPITQFAALYNSVWAKTVVWFSKHVLHLSHNFALDYQNGVGGSKDTTYIYVQVLCYVIAAAMVTVIWSVLDRRRPSYPQLYNWFIVGLRLSMAVTMISYGAVKIFPAQFPAPSLSKLLQTYGDSSPMGLLWTFMGGSWLYSGFAGAMELLAALLLVVPRLATLGTLVFVADMTNILMLNLGYDVPVKLGCINFLVMAAIVLLPDLGRLIDFFVRNRPIQSAPPRPLFRRPWLNWVAIALQVAFGVVLLSYNLYRSHQLANRILSQRSAPLYGIWLVDEFQMDGRLIPPLVTDPVRWHRLIVESFEDAAVQTMAGTREGLHLHSEGATGSFVLTSYRDPNWIAQFSSQRPQPELLVLQGEIGGHPASITLHREDESKFILNSRGFHWIQDFADNE